MATISSGGGGIITIPSNDDNISAKRKHEQMVLDSIVDRNDEIICMPPPLGKPSKRSSKSVGESRNTSSSSSRKTKAVLDEDTFIDSLSHIIERDYFPELSKMKRHLRLLDAYDAGDTTTIRLLHNQILTEQRQGPTSSHSGGGTTPGPFPTQNKGIVANGGIEDEESAIKEAMAGISVEQFMQSYTSEDNASFEILHEKDKEDWRKARHWAFECLENGTDGGKRAGMLMLYHIGGKVMTAEERQRFDQLVDGQQAIGDDRPNRVDTWKFRVRNQFMFPPEMAESQDVSRMLTTGDQRAFLALPSSSSSSSSSMLQIASSSSSSSSSSISTNKLVGPGARPPKIIQRTNTSLRHNTTTTEPSTDLSLSSDDALTPLEMPHTPSILSSECQTVASTDSFTSTKNKTNKGGIHATTTGGTAGQYRTVAMTPSPMPGIADPSPMMTWGAVDGTPQILDTKEILRTLPLPWVTTTTAGCGVIGSDKISYEPPPINARDRIAQTLGGNTTSRSHSHSRSGKHSSSSSSAAASSSSSHRHKKTKLTPAAISLAQKLSSTRSGLSIPGGPNSTPFGGSMSLSDSYRIPDRHTKSKSSVHSSTQGHGMTGSLIRTKSSKTPLTTTTGQGSSLGNEKNSVPPLVNTDDLLRNF